MVSVGMTGSRNGLTAEQRQAAADWLLTIQPEWLHHGDCIGADAELDGIARELDIQTCVHPPERSDRRAYCEGDVILEPLPYLMRNQGIVAESDILLAFPDGPEKLRSGTWSTVKYAREKGIQIIIVMPDGHQQLDHEMRWLDRRSFNFKSSCVCGWQGTTCLMEKDAEAEYKKHLAVHVQ
jgi:hypothetical protein